MPKASGRPRVLLKKPTASSAIVAAVQAAYIRAGQPELRAFCKRAGVSYGFAYATIMDGEAPRTVALLEAMAAALGSRLGALGSD